MQIVILNFMEAIRRRPGYADVQGTPTATLGVASTYADGQGTPTATLGWYVTLWLRRHARNHQGHVSPWYADGRDTPRVAVGISWSMPRVSVRRRPSSLGGLEPPYADGTDLWPSA
jgi:hypothetical protein